MKIQIEADQVPQVEQKEGKYFININEVTKIKDELAGEKGIESLSGFIILVVYSLMLVLMGIVILFQPTSAKPYQIAVFISAVLMVFMLSLGTKLGYAQALNLKPMQNRLGILVAGNFGLIFALIVTALAEVDYPTLSLILIILGICGFGITIPYVILRNKALKGIQGSKN